MIALEEQRPFQHSTFSQTGGARRLGERRHAGRSSLRRPPFLGLRIEHTVPTYPDVVVLWVSLAWSRAPFAHPRETLEPLGYRVLE